jgi:hypothetical protein
LVARLELGYVARHGDPARKRDLAWNGIAADRRLRMGPVNLLPVGPTTPTGYCSACSFDWLKPRRLVNVKAMSNDSLNQPMTPADEHTAALFIQMVFQLSSLATMLLGRAPHPDTGQTMKDLEAAQVVIDQLDMLERKTKGNLSKAEEQVLRGSLTDLRMAYVEAIHAPAPGPDVSASSEESKTAAEPQPTATTDESKVKFSKKY